MTFAEIAWRARFELALISLDMGKLGMQPSYADPSHRNWNKTRAQLFARMEKRS